MSRYRHVLVRLRSGRLGEREIHLKQLAMLWALREQVNQARHTHRWRNEPELPMHTNLVLLPAIDLRGREKFNSSDLVQFADSATDKLAHDFLKRSLLILLKAYVCARPYLRRYQVSSSCSL